MKIRRYVNRAIGEDFRYARLLVRHDLQYGQMEKALAAVVADGWDAYDEPKIGKALAEAKIRILLQRQGLDGLRSWTEGKDADDVAGIRAWARDYAWVWWGEAFGISKDDIGHDDTEDGERS